MSSFLSGKLKTIIVETIRDKLTLVGDRLNPEHWNAEMRDFLSFCIKSGHITADEVKEMVRKRINNLGRAAYNTHLINRKSPDNLVSPQVLAYALRSGELLEREITSIRFDHGETSKTFYSMIEESFIQKVADQL